MENDFAQPNDYLIDGILLINTSLIPEQYTLYDNRTNKGVCKLRISNNVLRVLAFDEKEILYSFKLNEVVLDTKLLFNKKGNSFNDSISRCNILYAIVKFIKGNRSFLSEEDIVVKKLSVNDLIKNRMINGLLTKAALLENPNKRQDIHELINQLLVVELDKGEKGIIVGRIAEIATSLTQEINKIISNE